MAPCPACRMLVGEDQHHCRTCGTVFSAVELRARAQAVMIAQLRSLAILGGVTIAAATLLFVIVSDTSQALPASPAEWPPAGSANKQVTTAYRHFRHAVNDARQGCEAASKALELTIQAINADEASVYEGRRAAEHTQRACRAAHATVSAIPTDPDLPRENQAHARRVIADCQEAMSARQDAASEIASMLSVDRSLITIDALQEASLQGERDARQCSSSLRSLAGLTGVDITRLRD